MKIAKVPPNARIVRAYHEFRSYVFDFARGRYPFLWIVSRPGTAKTQTVQAAVRGQLVYSRKGGQLTPLQFYKDCFKYRGQPIVLDDAEHFLDQKIGEKLITALGETVAAKRLCYGTTSRALGNVPDTFFTTSSLCILANKATNHEAILSRATIVYFDPTNAEVHRSVADWYWDQEIHDWFGQHLNRLGPVDSRWYVVASHDKRADRDWRQIVLQTHAIDPISSIVQDLEIDPKYPTREDKARRFVEVLRGKRGASRQTYFRHHQRLKEGNILIPEVENTIPLHRTQPPSTPSVLELDSMAIDHTVALDGATDDHDATAREKFAQPINGIGTPPPPPRPTYVSDRTAFEPHPDDE